VAATLPLSPAAFSILIALTDGEKHGYAIMKEISVIAPGVKMGPGTLYGTLDRMVSSGLISETSTKDDERRRYYELTSAGLNMLRAEKDRISSLVSIAKARLTLRDARV
jgi:DNA-binding PadR family transcriptional regulator